MLKDTKDQNGRNWVELDGLDEKSKDLIREWVKQHREVYPVWQNNQDNIDGYEVAMRHLLNALEIKEYI